MNRRLVVIIGILICCAKGAFAQWPVDSAKKETLAQLSTKYKDALIVIDGSPVTKNEISEKPDLLKPANIFDIIALDKDKNQDGQLNPIMDVIVITTKAAVKTHYQKTLSSVSLDYRNYLDANHNDDSHLQYILNSQPLKSESEEQLDRLYKLSPEKITSVSLTTVDGKKTLIIDINFDE